ncbi:MAG: DUF680 domain-containing protein [Mesorhizobium sp.]
MKTIALTAAALLVAAGSAFAASDHFQAPSDNNSAASVDSTYTSSVKSTVSPGVFVGQSVADTTAHSNRTHWGNN